ncbi:transporter, major facilitator subfamily protein [Pelomyxa schiedti]|nr:transporter, major facilitator subfamily protein [Pelomyxa schiedti]
MTNNNGGGGGGGGEDLAQVGLLHGGVQAKREDETTEKHEVVSEERGETAGGPTWARWYVLCVFSLVSCVQCLNWFTFSSVPEESMEYYGISNSTLNALLNWGPLMIVVGGPVVACALSFQRGLRTCVIIGAAAILSGSVVRAIPCWVSDDLRKSAFGVAFLHIGQILNAICGPVAMVSVPRVACVWFPDKERTTATAIAFISNGAGFVLGFVVGPQIATASSRIPLLIYTEIVMAGVVSAPALIHFPSSPRSAPSAAALAANIGEKKTNSLNIKHIFDWHDETSYIRGIWHCFSTASACLTILSGSMQAGIISGWAGCVPQILANAGYDTKIAGWMGFSNTLAAIVGSVANGIIADKLIPFHLKRLLLCEFFLSICLYSIICLCLPGPWWETPVITIEAAALGVIFAFAGLFQGALYPVMLELASEVAYPVGEGTVGGIMSVIWNVCTLVLLACASFLTDNEAFNLVTVGVLLSCTGMVIGVTEDHKRTTAGQ